MEKTVAIVGVTGAVGIELVRLLEARDFPCGRLVPLASARSAGKEIGFRGRSCRIEEATLKALEGVDIALFSAGSDTSRELGRTAAEKGVVVIDNSSAFRMEEDVPLVVPEINAEALRQHRNLIANPNCSTAITLMGLYPLHRAFGLEGFVASTYQAVSGSGAAAVKELEEQVRAWGKGERAERAVYPHPIAFNLLPEVDAIQENGFTREEMKMVYESRKIMGLPTARISTTCVRVPVFRAHSIAVHASFENPVELVRARVAIEEFPGVELLDDPSCHSYPTPLAFSGKENCGVGRLRKDPFFVHGLAFWVVGDQLWKGAALNAVQIAEAMLQMDLI